MSNPSAETLHCEQCGTEMSPQALACPGCGRLVHGEQLKALAGEAEHAELQGDIPAALAAWRQALELLPAGSKQQQLIAARIEELGKKAPGFFSQPAPKAKTSHGKAQAGGIAGLGALGVLLWKFKFIVVLALTKAKFLVLGLTKASTLFSMLLSLNLYWRAYGWKFALGLIASIYVHEMGHVAALRRFGFKAEAPMFIPGFGALVLLRQHPSNPVENSRIGLAGPIWGLAAALFSLGVYLVTKWPSWLAIAQVGAWINLFNLMPVWQLDGGRGFSSLNRNQRWAAVAGIATAWYFSEQSLLILLLLCGWYQAMQSGAPEKPDKVGLIQYLALVAVLSAMCLLPVPGVGG